MNLFFCVVFYLGFCVVVMKGVFFCDGRWAIFLYDRHFLVL